MQIWGEDNSVGKPMGTRDVQSVTPAYSYQNFTITDINKWAVPKKNYTIQADSDGYYVTWTGYNDKTYTTAKTAWPDNSTWPTDAATGKLTADESLHIKIDSSTLDLNANPELAGISFQLDYNIARDSTLQDIIDSLNNTKVDTSNNANIDLNITPLQVAGNPLSIGSYGYSMFYPAFLYSDRTFGTKDTDFIKPDPSDTKKNFIHSTGTDEYGINFTMGTTKNLTADSTAHAAQTTWKITGKVNPDYTYMSATSSNIQLNEDPFWWSEQYPQSGHYVANQIKLDGTLNGLQSANDIANIGNLKNEAYLCIYFDFITDDKDYEKLATDAIDNPKSVGSLSIRIDGLTTSTTDAQIKDFMDAITTIDISASGNGYAGISTGALAKHVNISQNIYDYEIGLNIQSSDNAFDAIKIEYKSLRTGNLGIADSNVKTHADASASITAVSNALDIVSAQRSLFGSYQNRLEHAKANAGNMEENVQASESSIRDADMADEMVAYSANNILMQAGEAILAQQNTSLSQVLSLLQR